mmetsp:Transcript_19474/g.25675  ORF Transcript_19474/g.25675 Transcript_19474/m.25675 type:complete len:755 (+) Transcript_19474:77-2341(+)
MGNAAGFYSSEPADLESYVAKILEIKESNPDNIACACFEKEYYESLESIELKKGFLKCLASGIANPDSSMGCYANHPTDYDMYKPFFKAALEKYHKVDLSVKKHTNNWSLEGVEGLPANSILDISQIGLPALSMRVRVGRNLNKFPLPASMSKEQRIEMETTMGSVFEALISKPELGGRYVSITPGHSNEVSVDEYNTLVESHIMFKDMSADPYLTAAGIASDWPHGRGCYISEDKGFIIWVGEEDHLRIMCMQRGTLLNAVFDRLKAAIDVVEALIEGGCAKSDDFGVVTSCPTNMGTGMRASVHIPLPKLTFDGTDEKAKSIAKPLGLSVRGLGGEHTPIGSDGTVDISPSARFCISEAEIITALYLGLKKLKAEEDAAMPSNEELVKRILKIKETNADNIMASSFDKTYYDGLPAEKQSQLLKCCLSGIFNPCSQMGCYANFPSDYDEFEPFFKVALEKYHKVDLSETCHQSNWSLEGVEGLPENGVLDLAALGLPELSMRVRTGRNLNKYPLPASMTQQDRVDLELAMGAVFDALIAKEGFGGNYVSITPGHANEISKEEYEQLVTDHIMFKDMAADPYLTTAGIASHWPYGRGCYISSDRQFIIWVGEEDHLRIMCMKKGTILNEVFDRLKAAIDVVEELIDGGCAQSEKFGVVTSCPTNIGTGMRASVHIPLPNLTKDGTDAQAKAVAKPLGLSVRGLGGEHTPIGADGTVDISPSARFCISEAQIVTALYLGIQSLKAAEDAPIGRL